MSTSNKRKRADPPTLTLQGPHNVDQYFFDVPYYEWSLESFCRHSFDNDHRQKANDIASSFLSSTAHIKNSEGVPSVIRNAAEPLSRLRQAKIKRGWQALFLDELTKTAKARSDGYEAAKEDFNRAAALTNGLLTQLEEGGPFTDGVETKHDNQTEECKQFSESLKDGNGALSNLSQDSDSSGISNLKGDGVSIMQTAFSDCSDETEFIPDSQDQTSSSVGIFSTPPKKVNWIVGPGSLSSQLCTAHLWIDRGINISQSLANQRDNVMRALEILESADMLALRNFIYPPSIVQEVLSIEQWTETLCQWDKRYQHSVAADEVTDVMTFALALQLHTTYQEAVDISRTLDMTKPMTRIISNYLRTSAFWNMTTDEILSSKPVNEDTFINNVIKPVIDGLFGDLPHITMHWTRDGIKCGDEYNSEERLYPDFHLSIKNHSIVFLEAKPPSGTAAEYMEDRRKLFDEMKLAVDGLLRRGIDKPVVGFLVSGFRVETFAMTLDFEASYLPVDLGSFDLVGSRYQFGSLLTAAKPLLSARDTVNQTLSAMYGVKGEPIKTTWIRGSYHTKPIEISPDQE